MPRDYHQIGLERLQAVGLEPDGPFPGIKAHWDVKCTRCGRTMTRIPNPRIKGCHYCRAEDARQEAEERARQKQAAEAAERRAADHLAYRNSQLKTKNLRALEPLPDEDGALWLVACKYCNRTWQMPEDRLRACPHKGAGGGVYNPEPTKSPAQPSTQPPAVDDMTPVASLETRRYAVLKLRFGHRWTLAVSPDQFLLNVNAPSYQQSMHQSLNAEMPETAVRQAEQLLREAGWAVDGEWAETFDSAGAAYRWVAVTTEEVVTAYVLGREILKSESQKPDVPAKAFAKRAGLRRAGTMRDSQDRTWSVYLRAEAEGARRLEEAAQRRKAGHPR